MTLFSRCDASQVFVPSPRLLSRRRVRAEAGATGMRRAVSDFLEEVGILARYAVGLDYYGRSGTTR